jgi:hypothetical protein
MEYGDDGTFSFEGKRKKGLEKIQVDLHEQIKVMNERINKIPRELINKVV